MTLGRIIAASCIVAIVKRDIGGERRGKGRESERERERERERGRERERVKAPIESKLEGATDCYSAGSHLSSNALWDKTRSF